MRNKDFKIYDLLRGGSNPSKSGEASICAKCGTKRPGHGPGTIVSLTPCPVCLLRKQQDAEPQATGGE